MRLAVSTIVAAIPVIGVVAILAAPSVSWSQPGSVLGHQKISDLEGNFTAMIDNLDELGGTVCSLGDLDGAGPSVVALAVGAVGDDDGGGNRGCVYVLFLDGNGAVLSHQKISNTQGGFTGLLDNLDGFGSSVASLGDLAGAGPSVAALAVGVAGDDDGGSDRGAVYVLFLNASGSVLSNQKISDLQGGFTGTIANLDEFGGAVAGLGDLDGAGPSAGALAVGAIGTDDGGANRGAVWVLFLNAAGSVLSHQKIGNGSGGLSVTIDSADEFGSAVAGLGDLDGAGPSVAALAVGTIGDDDGGADRGAVYVLFLQSTGTVLSHQKISSTQGGFTGALDNLDEFGGAVADLGDLDSFGPSARAISVGTIGDDDGGSGRGCTYVVFISSAGSVTSQQKISSTQGGFTGALSNGDEFGGACAGLGDIDGAGPAAGALVVGSSFDDDGGEDRGAVWVLQLRGLTLSDTEPVPGTPRAVLHAARPNPFNPRTTISFAVAVAGQVTIDIWDAHGRRVRRLVDGPATPGQHQVTWDGLDDAGRELASGAYFYGLALDGRAAPVSRKAILLK
jgi:hypothetical protein